MEQKRAGEAEMLIHEDDFCFYAPMPCAYNWLLVAKYSSHFAQIIGALDSHCAMIRHLKLSACFDLGKNETALGKSKKGN